VKKERSSPLRLVYGEEEVFITYSETIREFLTIIVEKETRVTGTREMNPHNPAQNDFLQYYNLSEKGYRLG